MCYCFWGRGSICQSILVSQVLFNSSQAKACMILFCGGKGGLSSTLCSSDKFCPVVCNSSLCNWFLGGHLFIIYLSISIYTSDFMYQCRNIVIHLLLLIQNYIWIAIMWHIHIYEHGDKKSNLQLKTHHISVIYK